MISTAAAELPKLAVKGIPVADVRLLDSPFRDAQKRDLDYLLQLDPDRLLSGMRAAARLKPKGELYGGWEKNGSGIVGHYLSALAWMSAATGDAKVKQRMDYVVSEMAEFQKNRGDGGLYASPWEADKWYASLGRGDLRLSNVVPWYVGHKTLAGVRDAWLTGGNLQAKDVLIRYADWCVQITSKLTDQQWSDLTSKEFGAPNEVLADLYAETGKPEYLALAKRFRKEPMVAAFENNNAAIINGRHANTEIPLFVGYERIYEATGEERWHKAATNFWDAVISKQSFAFGGNSIWEAFINPAEYDRKLADICGPETCNTYNMLKLTRQLHELQPQARYADYMERALYNHILSSMGPAPDNGFAYYTPTRPGHYKRYSLPFDSFWCCVGSGMENHGRYGAYIYSASEDRLLVNLFIPSQVRWKGHEVRQTSDLLENGIVTLAVKSEKPADFTLSVRCPGWVDARQVRLRVNGKDLSLKPEAGSYLDVKRTWQNGDVLQAYFPPEPRMEKSAGGGYAAFYQGPILLAAKLGDQGLEKTDFYADGSVPFIQLGRKEMDQAKVPAVSSKGSPSLMQKGKTGYTLKTTTGEIPLVPFYQVGLERYSVYFPLR
ncbi:glycoside hydrolase family 127 protein [Luteolibacter soli]